jgi:Histidine kinase-, DNA gyrase B-, and HSP90-like ATPase
VPLAQQAKEPLPGTARTAPAQAKMVLQALQALPVDLSAERSTVNHCLHPEVALEFETKYALKLFFPNPAFVQVYFEAVANAIDAKADKINISIRTGGKVHAPEYVEITIRDNGTGFTDERYERFKEVREPTDDEHKGLGRLIYLQYFSEVAVSSVYGEKKRTFLFAENFDGSNTVVKVGRSERRGSELVFRKFRRTRLKSYDDLKPGVLKQVLLEQFLPVLYSRKLAGNPVEITIDLIPDESNPEKEFFPDTQTLSGGDLPDLKRTFIEDNSIEWFSKIGISYAITGDAPKPLRLTAADIDGRAIRLNLLSEAALPAGTSVIFLFKSELFNGRSDSARQRLVLPPDVQESAFYRALKTAAGRILDDELPEIRTHNESTRTDFETRFPHLIGLFDAHTVGLIDRNEAIGTAQERFFQHQRQVLESDPTSDAAFQKSLEMSARCLAEYVLYRDWVIKRLGNTSSADREATVHDLVVPRYSRFEESSLVEDVYRNNAWILDDKFMTFRTILSESTMTEVIRAITLEEDAADDDGRPDISMIFSADPAKAERVDVVVVELKRRRTDDKDANYAGVQLVKRARLLVDHCPNIQRVWYYGIIDIDDGLAQLLKDLGWVPLYSKGRVFFRDFNIARKADDVPIPTPTFLLSFDAVTADAAARNHAFLELLKSNFRRQDGKTPASQQPVRDQAYSNS